MENAEAPKNREVVFNSDVASKSITKTLKEVDTNNDSTISVEEQKAFAKKNNLSKFPSSVRINAGDNGIPPLIIPLIPNSAGEIKAYQLTVPVLEAVTAQIHQFDKDKDGQVTTDEFEIDINAASLMIQNALAYYKKKTNASDREIADKFDSLDKSFLDEKIITMDKIRAITKPLQEEADAIAERKKAVQVSEPIPPTALQASLNSKLQTPTLHA